MTDKYKGHTPGPWYRTNLGADIIDIRADSPRKGNLICSIYAGSRNAILIADAPELLRQRDEAIAELKAIVQGWRDTCNPKFQPSRLLTPWEAERMKFAEAVIAECGKEDTE